jgi:hypothetical protein
MGGILRGMWGVGVGRGWSIVVRLVLTASLQAGILWMLLRSVALGIGMEFSGTRKKWMRRWLEKTRQKTDKALFTTNLLMCLGYSFAPEAVPTLRKNVGRNALILLAVEILLGVAATRTKLFREAVEKLQLRAERKRIDERRKDLGDRLKFARSVAARARAEATRFRNADPDPFGLSDDPEVEAEVEPEWYDELDDELGHLDGALSDSASVDAIDLLDRLLGAIETRPNFVKTTKLPPFKYHLPPKTQYSSYCGAYTARMKGPCRLRVGHPGSHSSA